jgi:tRNA pseudouridine55 synthase
MATGVLPILLGRATTLSSIMLDGNKRYTATVKLGLTTDTEDVTGAVISMHEGTLPDTDTVIEAVNSFLGESEQIPPMYSALKVGGKKLCDLARDGIVIERQPRKITVFSIDATPLEAKSDYMLNVSCSSGTYIRTLCADIGKKLGCGGVMATLKRTMAGGFSIKNAVTLEQLGEMSCDERTDLLLPTESLFYELETVKLPAFYHKLCTNGCEIYQKKIRTDFPIGTRLRLCSESGEFFGLGEVREYPDGTAVKAIKFL